MGASHRIPNEYDIEDNNSEDNNSEDNNLEDNNSENNFSKTLALTIFFCFTSIFV